MLNDNSTIINLILIIRITLELKIYIIKINIRVDIGSKIIAYT